MKNLRIEITDDGNGLYLAASPDGIWARTTEIDETITADWDAQGRLLGIEIAGTSARAAITGLVSALLDAPAEDRQALRDALATMGLVATASATPSKPKRKVA